MKTINGVLISSGVRIKIATEGRELFAVDFSREKNEETGNGHPSYITARPNRQRGRGMIRMGERPTHKVHINISSVFVNA